MENYQFNPEDYNFKSSNEFLELQGYWPYSYSKITARGGRYEWYIMCRKIILGTDDDRWAFCRGVYTVQKNICSDSKDYPTTIYQGCITSKEFAELLLIHLMGTTTNEGILKYGTERILSK